MNKQRKPVDTPVGDMGYGPRFLLWELSAQANRLKAQILNLVDSVITDTQQNNAVKGLIKDFTSKFYWTMHENIVDYLDYKGILDKHEQGSFVEFDEPEPPLTKAQKRAIEKDALDPIKEGILE